MMDERSDADCGGCTDIRPAVLEIPGGVTAPRGFEAAAAAAGIKYSGRTDMALIYSRTPCEVAGTFTSNVVKAAPVLWDRRIVRESSLKVQAVVVNSGIANACTGAEGMEICARTAAVAAGALQIRPESVLVGSTGVIGMQIPMERVERGVKLLTGSLSYTAEAGEAAAKAIMTTDTHCKQAAVQIRLPKRDLPREEMPADVPVTDTVSGGRTFPQDNADWVTVTIGGMAKGSGMIHPGMCTMLAYVTTDAAISKELLQRVVSDNVDQTFNMISVDGDMSTNDTVLVLANGEAGNAMIRKDSDACQHFSAALREVLRMLAMAIAADGEGATKLIESRVQHADTREHARMLAKSVIRSNLTKAAVFGRDANWGRILCALGYAGVSFDPEQVDLWLGDEADGILIFSEGRAADFDEDDASLLLGKEKVVIRADMHMGEESAVAWGCDLTYDYVRINADYRS